MRERVQAVLFDMDGVLFDTERLGMRIFHECCAKHGYPNTGEIFYLILGSTTASSRAILAEKLGASFPYDAVMGEFHERLNEIARRGELPLKPGVAECVAGLRERGICTALATSTAPEITALYLQGVPVLRDAFDARVCGAEGGRSKPAPDIYLEAARRLGVAPERCLGVEDSVNGLKSLTAANCPSVMIPDLVPFSDALAPYVTYRLESLHQLCPLIDRLALGARVRAEMGGEG